MAKVRGRRKLRFVRLSDVIADAERITAGGEPRTLGNWSPGQIMMHLARTCDVSIDGGGSFKRPLWMRAAGVLFKRRVLRGPMPSGVKVPRPLAARINPDATTTADGLYALRKAITRLERTVPRGVHPFFGPLTRDEWEQFHLRHAELHLSFLLPAE